MRLATVVMQHELKILFKYLLNFCFAFRRIIIIKWSKTHRKLMQRHHRRRKTKARLREKDSDVEQLKVD